MDNIKIDKGVPIEKGGAGRKYTYPFSKMKAGDSFFVKEYKDGHSAVVALRAYILKNKLKWKVVRRKQGDGMRIWATNKTVKNVRTSKSA